MKVVVYCAHADDMVLGAGGYIARLTEEGNEVAAVFATDGLLHAPKYIDTREWGVEACKILGVKEKKWLNIANQRFDTFALIDINKRYEALNLRPDLLITNSHDALNKDHRLIYESARVATRPSVGSHTNVLSFGVVPWSLGTHFDPDFFVDITKTLEKKISAMKLFISEVRDWPHPTSIEAIATRAKYWGSLSGFECAEPFKVVQWYQRGERNE